MPSYEANTIRARLHTDGVSLSLIPVVGNDFCTTIPIFRLRENDYGREMASAICAAIGTVNKKHGIRHFSRDGVTEIWVGPGCV